MRNNPKSQFPQKNDHSFPKLLLIAIALILIVELGFHLILPLLGIATVITVGVLAGAWGIVVGTIVFFCIVGLLFFVIPGALILLLGLFALIWVIIAVVLFPVILPIIFPMLIILLFIGYARHN
jgi:hypothetical protein